MSNSIGQFLKLHSFGESHGPAMGAVIEGCPAGLHFDFELLAQNLERRRPGSSRFVSQRNENDSFEILSGVFQGKTLGTPLAILVRNTEAKSSDYKDIVQGAFRPGHADEVWTEKYVHQDLRGGGRSSGRETLSRVIAGSVSQMLLSVGMPNLSVRGFVAEIGDIALDRDERLRAHTMPVSAIEKFELRLPSLSKNSQAMQLLNEAREMGWSYGGVVELFIEGLDRGLGEPVFGKLKSRLSEAMMSIGATMGLEFGAGFAAAKAEGSEFHSLQDPLKYGGMNGGMSNGEPLVLRVAFKPTSSVLDVAKKGRHDPCIVPRAVPVVEAMAYFCLADLALAKRLNNI